MRTVLTGTAILLIAALVPAMPAAAAAAGGCVDGQPVFMTYYEACVGKYDCVGAWGRPGTPAEYQGVAYCDDGHQCWTWENGQTGEPRECVVHVRWDRIPAIPPALSAPSVEDCVRAFGYNACNGEYGCVGVWGDPDGPNRYTGLAFCDNQDGCYVWQNGQRTVDLRVCDLKHVVEVLG